MRLDQLVLLSERDILIPNILNAESLTTATTPAALHSGARTDALAAELGANLSELYAAPLGGNPLAWLAVAADTDLVHTGLLSIGGVGGGSHDGGVATERVDQGGDFLRGAEAEAKVHDVLGLGDRGSESECWKQHEGVDVLHCFCLFGFWICFLFVFLPEKFIGFFCVTKAGLWCGIM